MTNASTSVIRDKADFLAHAAFLVEESLDQYAQLADSMEIHNNLATAAQFRELQAMEEEQMQWLESQAAGLVLPEIAPWEFAWYREYQAGMAPLTDIEYTGSPAGVLSAALQNERFTESVYRRVAERVADPEVKALALEMAGLQVQQISLLIKRLDELPPEARQPLEDMDPPNVPG